MMFIICLLGPPTKPTWTIVVSDVKTGQTLAGFKVRLSPLDSPLKTNVKGQVTYQSYNLVIEIFIPMQNGYMPLTILNQSSGEVWARLTPQKAKPVGIQVKIFDELVDTAAKIALTASIQTQLLGDYATLSDGSIYFTPDRAKENDTVTLTTPATKLYSPSSQKVLLKNNTTTVIRLQRSGPQKIRFTITFMENKTKLPRPGAKIDVHCRGTTHKLVTDLNGAVEIAATKENKIWTGAQITYTVLEQGFRPASGAKQFEELLTGFEILLVRPDAPPV